MIRKLLFACLLTTIAAAQSKPRARDLGVPFDGTAGPLNAITDVQGVEVGHTTLIRGDGKVVPGQGPVRTGVTAVFPRGKSSSDMVHAAWFSQNGDGELTGTTYIEDMGFLQGPVMLTNTHSVGVVRDAVIQWRVQHGGADQSGYYWSLPVVGETWDGWLNDINGFHVRPEHVFAAMDSARGGAVPEGNVGGGTGMICNEFKGGIGTASRKIAAAAGHYTVGVLVQCNFGRRPNLLITGVPVGKEIPEQPAYEPEDGSIIIIVATDAPLLPHQLKRVAKRAGMGLARTGSFASNGSGDIFIAFSTANAGASRQEAVHSVQVLPNDSLNAIFEATVQATEEAIVNAMIAADTMVGANNRRVIALPHDRLVQVLRKYNRLAK